SLRPRTNPCVVRTSLVGDRRLSCAFNATVHRTKPRLRNAVFRSTPESTAIGSPTAKLYLVLQSIRASLARFCKLWLFAAAVALFHHQHSESQWRIETPLVASREQRQKITGAGLSDPSDEHCNPQRSLPTGAEQAAADQRRGDSREKG